MKKYQIILLLNILMIGGKVNADVPLSLENIITDKNKLKLDYSVTYANSSTTENTLDEFVL